MLNEKEFIEIMKVGIRECLPDDMQDYIIIDDVEVVKMNDQKLHGLTFRMPGLDAAPTIYIDDAYRSYMDGVDIRYLAGEMANQYSNTRYAPRPPEIDLSYDKVRDNLTVRLLEKKRNKEFLMNTPHVSVGHGLALIVDINMGEDKGGDWRVVVNNNVLETMGIDRETLLAQAMKSAAAFDPPRLVDMSNALFSKERKNLLDQEEPIAPDNLGGMYVLTTKSGSHGAAALFYPDVMEKAAEILGSGYYVLPSSIHEAILVPDGEGINEKDLCDMVKQANRSVVDEKDILSDNVFHYSMDDRRLDKVSADRDRDGMVAEAR